MSNEKALLVEDVGSLVRPLYSRGLLLEDADLTDGVNYTRELMRLMFRSLFGCGVICGLKVSATLDCNNRKIVVGVERGLALDCMGNLIEVNRSHSLTWDPECKPIPAALWVLACYREQQCRPKEVTCSSDDDSQVVKTRAYGGYKILVVGTPPKCACTCEPYVPAPASAGQDCCQGAGPAAMQPQGQPAQQGQGTTTPPDYCACYDDHYNGICDCDCGCDCVVIGKIDITLDAQRQSMTNVEANDPNKPSVVRFIRPMLIGRERCKARSATTIQAAPVAAAGPGNP